MLRHHGVGLRALICEHRDARNVNLLLGRVLGTRHLDVVAVMALDGVRIVDSPDLLTGVIDEDRRSTLADAFGDADGVCSGEAGVGFATLCLADLAVDLHGLCGIAGEGCESCECEGGNKRQFYEGFHGSSVSNAGRVGDRCKCTPVARVR